MAKLSRDLGAGGTLHPRETLFTAGNLGALNAEVITPCDGSTTITLDLRGTFNLTVEVSGTVDGTNWVPIPLRPLNVASIAYVAAVAGSAPGVWAGNCAGYRLVRARVTAYTSGAAVASLSAGMCLLDDSLQGRVTPALATTTGASGAAVTLTLNSPGAGLRHYITYLSIVRSAAALLTAGATPTVVTTTNLPGNLAFTFGADAAAQGVDKIIREDFAFPIAASAQATNTTIVCPATTNVIWRITAGCYFAP